LRREKEMKEKDKRERDREGTASISLPPTRTPVDGRSACRIKGILYCRWRNRLLRELSTIPR